jgi:hypothetical protein
LRPLLDHREGTPLPGRSTVSSIALRPELSDAIAEFLLKACAADRADRFTTAKEMKSVLEVARSNA